MTTNEQPMSDTSGEQEANTGPHAHIRELETENKGLRQRLASTELKEMGLDPNTGLGKAILKTYNGSYEDGDIQKFAVEEYGWEAPSSESPVVAEQIEAEQRITQLETTSESVQPPEQVPIIQAAAEVFESSEATRDQLIQGLGLVAEDIRRQLHS